jgi:ribosomal-protein-alanine N-acetyltransferase
VKKRAVGRAANERRRTAREVKASRVHLRAPREEDLREFVALRAQSREFLEPWEADAPPGVDTFAESGARRFFVNPITPRRERLFVCRSHDGAILGVITFSNIVRGSLQSATIGYWIGREFARQGYMSDALELALDHAFRALGLHRVEAAILGDNQPSKAIAKKLGFVCEGVSRGYAKLAGRWRDHERWAITLEAWRARRQRPR